MVDVYVTRSVLKDFQYVPERTLLLDQSNEQVNAIRDDEHFISMTTWLSQDRHHFVSNGVYIGDRPSLRRVCPTCNRVV